MQEGAAAPPSASQDKLGMLKHILFGVSAGAAIHHCQVIWECPFIPHSSSTRDISIAVINPPAPGSKARPGLGAELHQWLSGRKKWCFGKVELCWKLGWAGANQGGSLGLCTGSGLRRGRTLQAGGHGEGTAAKLWENDCSSVSFELSSLKDIPGIFLFQIKAHGQNK